MNKYIVRSFEHIFEGRYGIESYFMIEDNLNIVEEAAYDESYTIMDSYADVRESLYEDAEEVRNSYDGYTYDEVLESLYEDNVAYEIYTIRDDCPFTEQQINKTICSNAKDFIEKYCDLIISR